MSSRHRRCKCCLDYDCLRACKLRAYRAKFCKAKIKDLEVADLEIKKKEPFCLYVGEERKFKTVSEALCFANERHAGAGVIKVDPGCYYDNIDMGTYTTDNPLSTGDFTYAEGVEIRGDTRPIAGFTYVDGGVIPSSVVTSVWTVSTDEPGIGPYEVLVAEYSPVDTYSYPFSLSAEGELADPENACAALVNDLTGKIGISRRGACNFIDKTTNVEGAGAVATIVVNNSDGLLTMIGPTTGTGPSVSMRLSDGNELITAVGSNPSLQIIISVDDVYSPPVGASGDTVTLSYDGGSQTVTVTVSGSIQPGFNAAVAPGDKLIFVVPDFFNLGFYGSVQKAVVASVLDNTITLVDPLTLTEGMTNATMTFVPRVEFKPATSSNPILSVNNDGLLVHGIHFEDDALEADVTGEAMIHLQQAHVALPNVTILSNLNYNSGLLGIDSFLLNRRNGDTEETWLTCIGTTIRLFSCRSFLGSIYNIALNNPSIIEDSNLRMENLNILYSDHHGFVLTGLLVGNSNVDVASNVHLAKNPWRCIDLLGCSGFVAGEVLSKDNSEYSPFGPGFATGNFVLTDASKLVVKGDLTVENNLYSYGVEAYNRSLVELEGDMIADPGSEDFLYRIYYNAEIDAVNSTISPVNVRTLDADGTLDHAFVTQKLNGTGSALVLTLEPASDLYTGRTYKLVNLDGSAHTVTLDSGEYIGKDVPAGSNQLTFDAEEGLCAVLSVIDDSHVLVCDTRCLTFSTVLLSEERTAEASPKSTNPSVLAMLKENQDKRNGLC